MDSTTLRKMLIAVLGTVFAAATELLVSLVVLRTLELFQVDVGPLVLFAIVAFGALVCSLYTSMCVRIQLDLAVHGLIALIGWHSAFLGTCALTLIETKLDVDGSKKDLVDRGYILYYLERLFGVRPSVRTHDLVVHSAALLMYTYWIVDLAW
jgi:hypothetical protein